MDALPEELQGPDGETVEELQPEPEEEAPLPWPLGAKEGRTEPEEPEVTLEEVPEVLEPEPETEIVLSAAPAEEGAESLPTAESPSPAGDGGTPAEPRTSEDVRRELREFLDSVREKLDETPSGPSSPAGLLDYLEKLSDYLPEQERKRFLGSKERLAMESLKSRLAGKKGLRMAVAEKFGMAAPRTKEPLTRPLVVDTFSYLKDLSAWHPDARVGDAMRERIESLVARMGRAG